MSKQNKPQSGADESAGEMQGEDVDPMIDDPEASPGRNNDTVDDPAHAAHGLLDPEVDMEYSAPIAPAGESRDTRTETVGDAEVVTENGSGAPAPEDDAYDTGDIIAGDDDENGDIIAGDDDENGDIIAGDDDENGDMDETDNDDVTPDESGDRDTITIVEALIFASDEPLTFKQIKDILESSGAQPASPATGEDDLDDEPEEEANGDAAAQEPAAKMPAVKLTIGKVRRWVERLNAGYDTQGRPFRIVEVAGGFAFQTISEYGQYVGRLYTERSKRRLTQAALETLAIIAYKQPLSKPGVEAIRGVNADYVIKSLLEKNLIAIVGREDTVGRPLLYGTTKQFLKHFGLHSLNDLPKPREIEELLKESEEELAPPIEIIADQLPHHHEYMEPSIFDDVEREYGPAPESETNGNALDLLAAAATGAAGDSEDAHSHDALDKETVDDDVIHAGKTDAGDEVGDEDDELIPFDVPPVVDDDDDDVDNDDDDHDDDDDDEDEDDEDEDVDDDDDDHPVHSVHSETGDDDPDNDESDDTENVDDDDPDDENPVVQSGQRSGQDENLPGEEAPDGDTEKE